MDTGTGNFSFYTFQIIMCTLLELLKLTQIFKFLLRQFWLRVQIVCSTPFFLFHFRNSQCIPMTYLKWHFISPSQRKESCPLWHITWFLAFQGANSWIFLIRTVDSWSLSNWAMLEFNCSKGLKTSGRTAMICGFEHTLWMTSRVVRHWTCWYAVEMWEKKEAKQIMTSQLSFPKGSDD